MRKESSLQQVVNYFLELKGLDRKKVVYSRYVRSAKQLLVLCDENIDTAKGELDRTLSWADTNCLDWALETVTKRFLEV